MTHPDPRVQEIRDRNARALAEAVHAPPPDVADDPAAYLRWTAARPPAPPVPPAPRPCAEAVRYVRPQRMARPFAQAPDPDDERNRQLDALQKLIGEQAEPTPPEARNP